MTQMEPMTLLVCLVSGTRDVQGADLRLMRARFDALYENAAHNHTGLLVLHGGARGIDEEAELWVRGHRSKHVHSLVIGARWNAGGRASGPIRNDVLNKTLQAFRTAEHSVCAECFPGPNSIGTHDMIARLKRAGVECLTVTDLFTGSPL